MQTGRSGTEHKVVRDTDDWMHSFAEQRYRENGVFEISGFRKFEARLGLKKSKKDLQLSDECSIILYVVLKARSHTIFGRCASPGEIGWLYMLSTVFLDSSMVEHSAVNRRVVGSSPTRGVNATCKSFLQVSSFKK